MIIIRNKGNRENLTITGSAQELDRILAAFKTAASGMADVDTLFMDCHHSKSDKTLTVKPRHGV